MAIFQAASCGSIYFCYEIHPYISPKGQLKLFHFYPVKIGQQPQKINKKGRAPTTLFTQFYSELSRPA
jgi:hypothetical protein